MYINTFKYTPKDVSCQLCTEYVKKLGCIRSTTRKAKSCWMAVLLTAAPLKIRRLHLLPGLSERRYLPFRA